MLKTLSSLPSHRLLLLASLGIMLIVVLTDALLGELIVNVPYLQGHLSEDMQHISRSLVLLVVGTGLLWWLAWRLLLTKLFTERLQFLQKELVQAYELEDARICLAISVVLQQSKQPLAVRFNQVLDLLLKLQCCRQHAKGAVFLQTLSEGYLAPFVIKGQFSAEFQRNMLRELQSKTPSKHVQVEICSSACGYVSTINKQAHGHYRIPIALGKEVFGLVFLITEANPNNNAAHVAMLAQVGQLMAQAFLREQANISLERARDNAERVAARKSEFLANMSHEIRTPMNGVLGMLDLLRNTELSREQWDLLETAANSAEALLGIINDILDFSKLEAGKSELEAIAFDLPVLLEEVCVLMASHAQAKGLELTCFIPMSLAHQWQGDPTRIRQVLINLVGNAIKFTQQGEVALRVQQIGTEGLRIEIQDTGIGIATDIQAYLFQPFSQADISTARHFGGTGLGLSISRKLVTLMGGTIGFDSSTEKGTLFWFTLPLKAAVKQNQSRTEDFSGLRALVVDDHATSRMILEHYLGYWGFAVYATDSVAKALDLVDQAVRQGENFDLVLTDLEMPQQNGFMLLRALQQKPATAKLPCILLAPNRLEPEVDPKMLGFAQCLLKPIRQFPLYDAVTQALNTAQVVAQAPIKVQGFPDYSGKQVLVVEDNVVNQKVIVAMLAKFNLTVDLVANGEEALAQLACQRYDLVLMDCQMPVMDGYEATRQLRNSELACRRIPIIALTAQVVDGERDRCIAAGMDDYLGKPIERQKLATMLLHWLGEPELKQEQPGLKVVETITSNVEPIDKLTAPSNVWNEFAVLAKLDGNAELMENLIDLFIDDVPLQIKALQRALAESNLKAMGDIAHAIKGMAGYLGADAIALRAEKLELAVNHPNIPDLRVNVETLVELASHFVQQLQQRKNQPLPQLIASA